MNINGYTPQKKLNLKQFISLYSIEAEDIFEILYLSREIKQKKSVGERIDFLSGKHITLLTKPDYLRIQVAFDIAVKELGGNPIVIQLSGSKIEEELKDSDTTKVIQNFGVSAFVVDTANLSDAEVLKKYSYIPVINANAKSSPIQALAALLTVWEKRGALQGLKIAVIGNMVESDYSVLLGAAKCGMDISVICPKNSEPPVNILNYCSQFGSIDIYEDIEDGVRGADIVYIMTHELDNKYLFTDRYFNYTKKDAILLHSMPINRNVDISEDVINYPNSLIFEQASNNLIILEAALALIVGKFNNF